MFIKFQFGVAKDFKIIRNKLKALKQFKQQKTGIKPVRSFWMTYMKSNCSRYENVNEFKNLLLS